MYPSPPAFSPLERILFVFCVLVLKILQSRFHLPQDRRIMSSNITLVMGHQLSVLICWPQNCTIIIGFFLSGDHRKDADVFDNL